MIRLWINEIELDVSEDVYFPLSFSQADAKNPEKRKRSASKTIKLPGTKNNNSFFTSAYDLSISDVYGDLVGFDFDPSLRYPCLVTKNGSPIFKGAANLQKCITKFDVTNGRINEFHVLLYSELADIFQALGDIKVSELGWSDYDHLLSTTNIINSWTATTGSGYWYPYIDYGYAYDPTIIKTNELYPFIYVKEIVEKCFEYSGYTLDSNFYASTLVKKMTWGNGGGEKILLTSAEITSRRAHYTGDGTPTYNLPGSAFGINNTSFYWTKTIPVSDNAVMTVTQDVDPTAQFSESTGELVVANAGNYNLALSGTFPITYTYSDTGLSGQTIAIIVRWRIFVNNALIGYTDYQIVDNAAGSDSAVFSINQALDLSSGDIVYTDIQIITFGSKVTENAFNETLDITLDFDNTVDLDFTATNSELVDGDAVEIARFLPDMKAADFLRDQITMFNLYIGDPDADGNIKVEPERDYFFGTDDVDNWTSKLARDQEIEIESATTIEGKNYIFKWAQDRDYYKGLYFEKWGHDYGDYNYAVPSTWKKGDKIYELKSAQSCPVQLENTDIIVPVIVQVNESTQVRKPYKGKPRMFINGGTKSTTSGWQLVNSDTGTAYAQTVYPLANHLDSLTTATFDLNFGKPKEVFYTATTYTDDNLFFRHHAQFIRQLTGRDSKVVNAWFRLTEKDFYDNFMRRLCIIDGVVYRKNLVKDWIANDNKLVKVELLKITEGNSRANNDELLKPAVLPPMAPVGDGSGGKITGDQNASSYRLFYPVDTSSKDITITLDADTLRPGWTGEFINVGTGVLTLTTTGGGATGTDINGQTSIDITAQYDAPQVRFDGQYFYIK